MSKKNAAPEAATETVTQEASASETSGSVSGTSIRRALTMRTFVNIPWINEHVVGPAMLAKKTGAETRKPLCRIYGFVTGVTEKAGQLPDGTPSVNIVCHGQFEGESYIDGEITNAAAVFFPPSFAEYMKGLFAGENPPRMAEVDVDVMVEATGKTIPFAYVLTNYVEDKNMTPLRRLKAARKTPLSIGSRPAPAQIEGPKS